MDAGSILGGINAHLGSGATKGQDTESIVSGSAATLFLHLALCMAEVAAMAALLAWIARVDGRLRTQIVAERKADAKPLGSDQWAGLGVY